MQDPSTQDPSTRYVLRSVQPEDINDLMGVAVHLNSLNLRPDRNELQQRIEHSQNSFSCRIKDAMARNYMFALYDTVDHRVIGSSQVTARHGTAQLPHVSFCVQQQSHSCSNPNRRIKHQVLQLYWDQQGFTELGGLVLEPKHRQHPRSLGKQLSYVRFVWMAMNPKLFCSRVIAELLPPRNAQGNFVLWETVGRHLTGMSYTQADALSNSNKQFIHDLFPHNLIYTCLLPQEAQQVIGTVGPHTKPAYHMLTRIGFHSTPYVDPFDGGPHLHAWLHEITPFCQARQVKLQLTNNSQTSEEQPWGIIALWRPHVHNSTHQQPQFVACTVPYTPHDNDYIMVKQPVLDCLQLQPSEPAWLLPL
ncbi:MAG: arginine N-succinyltransferase [Myxococcota bacterium]